jgi:hypothetical protein
MLTVRRRGYRAAIVKWVSVVTLGTIIFMPKLDTLELPELRFPFVSTAAATEAD